MFQLCSPAIIYLLFSITQIIIDLFKGLRNTAMMKTIVAIIVTLLLNILCQRGLNVVSWIIVFIPFILMFYIIYINYAVFSPEGIKTFWYFCGIWSLYGVASILPYTIKNIMYNILDLFAKNFFGIFLAYVLLLSNIELTNQ